MAKVRKVKETMFCEFTAPERAERATELAESIADHARLEAEKANSAKDYKERIDSVSLGIKDLARMVRDNGEYRMVECEWMMNTPNTGFKTLVRTDTGEICRTEPMQQFEMQEPLFEEPAAEVATADTQEAEEDDTVETELTPPEADALEFAAQDEPTLAPEAEVDQAIDEAVAAAIKSTSADVVEIEPAKPKETRRPRGFGKTNMQGVM